MTVANHLVLDLQPAAGRRPSFRFLPLRRPQDRAHSPKPIVMPRSVPARTLADVAEWHAMVRVF